MFLLTFFGHVLSILAWTKCRLTKHVLSITHFHSCIFLTFPFKYYLYKKIKLSIKDYLLLIFTFMCMLIFLRILILSFQSHQTRILYAGLGMAWNRYGLSCNNNACIYLAYWSDCFFLCIHICVNYSPEAFLNWFNRRSALRAVFEWRHITGIIDTKIQYLNAFSFRLSERGLTLQRQLF